MGHRPRLIVCSSRRCAECPGRTTVWNRVPKRHRTYGIGRHDGPRAGLRPVCQRHVLAAVSAQGLRSGREPYLPSRFLHRGARRDSAHLQRCGAHARRSVLALRVDGHWAARPVGVPPPGHARRGPTPVLQLDPVPGNECPQKRPHPSSTTGPSTRK